MKYYVRVYCHVSYEVGECDCSPAHPYVLPDSFGSIREANDRGDEVVGVPRDDGIEWEVIDERGKVVC